MDQLEETPMPEKAKNYYFLYLNYESFEQFDEYMRNVEAEEKYELTFKLGDERHSCTLRELWAWMSSSAESRAQAAMTVTAEKIAAGCDMLRQCGLEEATEQDARLCFEAMIGAAPQPPAAESRAQAAGVGFDPDLEWHKFTAARLRAVLRAVGLHDHSDRSDAYVMGVAGTLLGDVRRVLAATPSDGECAKHVYDKCQMLVYGKVCKPALATPSEAAPAGRGEGIEIAAAYIEKQAQDYISENAATESDTGAVLWKHGQVGCDYYNTLTELAEEIRALAAQTTKDE